MKEAIIRDGKVFFANDVTIFAWKNGKRIRFEVKEDYRKRTLEKKRKIKLKAKEFLRKYSQPKKVDKEPVPDWIIEQIKNTSEVEMSPGERDHIVSEINSNLSDEAKQLHIITKDIGSFAYTFVNFGFNNYFFIDKVPISSLPTIKEMRERIDEKKNNRR